MNQSSDIRTSGPSADPTQGPTHRTVERVGAILELAAATGGARLTEIAAELGAAKSSVHGLLRGLVAVGYLDEDDGRYRVGRGLAVLVQRAGLDLPVRAVRDELTRLAAATGETALYGVRAGRSIVYVDIVESAHPLRYAIALHERRPLFATAIGKAVAAHLSADARSSAGLRRDAPRELLEELERVRRDGAAFNREQTVAGVAGVAAPVRDGADVIGGVGVAGPADRLTPEFARAAEQVAAAAARLSAAQGALGRVGRTARHGGPRPPISPSEQPTNGVVP